MHYITCILKTNSKKEKTIKKITHDQNKQGGRVLITFSFVHSKVMRGEMKTISLKKEVK